MENEILQAPKAEKMAVAETAQSSKSAAPAQQANNPNAAPLPPASPTLPPSVLPANEQLSLATRTSIPVQYNHQLSPQFMEACGVLRLENGQNAQLAAENIQAQMLEYQQIAPENAEKLQKLQTIQAETKNLEVCLVEVKNLHAAQIQAKPQPELSDTLQNNMLDNFLATTCTLLVDCEQITKVLQGAQEGKETPQNTENQYLNQYGIDDRLATNDKDVINAARQAAKKKDPLETSIEAATEAEISKILKSTNPILDKQLSKSLPNKAYIYSNKGEFLGICTNTQAKGIFFLSETLAKDILENPEKMMSSNEQGKSFIDPPSICEFYMGENTIKSLLLLHKKAEKKGNKAEIGGLFYLANGSKELLLDECEQCETGEGTMSGMTSKGNYDANKQYLGTWHTHPENSRPRVYGSPNVGLPNKTYLGHEIPTGHNASFYREGDVDYPQGVINDKESYSFDGTYFHNRSQNLAKLPGGLGVIVHPTGITIYRHSGEELLPNPAPNSTNNEPFITKPNVDARGIPFHVHSKNNMELK